METKKITRINSFNTAGVVEGLNGVYYFQNRTCKSRNSKKYTSGFCYKYVQYSCGTFYTAKEAALAYDKKSIQIRGFSDKFPLNYLKQKT